MKKLEIKLKKKEITAIVEIADMISNWGFELPNEITDLIGKLRGVDSGVTLEIDMSKVDMNLLEKLVTKLDNMKEFSFDDLDFSDSADEDNIVEEPAVETATKTKVAAVTKDTSSKGFTEKLVMYDPACYYMIGIDNATGDIIAIRKTADSSSEYDDETIAKVKKFAEANSNKVMKIGEFDSRQSLMTSMFGYAKLMEARKARVKMFA